MELYNAAFSQSVSEVGRLLDEGADINEQDYDGETALYRGIRAKKSDTVKLLLDRGANVNITDDVEETPLHRAASMGSPEITAMLLKAGAVVNCASSKGDTPLHCAATNSNRIIVEMLMEAGAVVKCEDCIGRTPLHIAATNRNPKIAALFLEVGIEVNCSDIYGKTPLHIASREGCFETTALLVESGASVNSKDNEGRTPLHYAGEGFNEENPISNSVNIASLLMANGGDVNCVDKCGQSPLHLAAISCNYEITAMLLESGADVKCIDVKGRTPLHVVGSGIKYDHHLPYEVEVLDLLLCAGARLDNKVQENFRLRRFTFSRILLNIQSIIQIISANLHKNNCDVDVDAMIDMNVKNSYSKSKLQSFKHECCNEVKKMKQKHIGNLTLFDVFNDSPYPGFISKVEEIEKVLDQAERQDEYPIYIKLMKYRFKRAVRRKALMDEAMDILPSVNPALAIPELGRMILARLSERDMTALINAFETYNTN